MIFGLWDRQPSAPPSTENREWGERNLAAWHEEAAALETILERVAEAGEREPQAPAHRGRR